MCVRVYLCVYRWARHKNQPPKRSSGYTDDEDSDSDSSHTSHTSSHTDTHAQDNDPNSPMAAVLPALGGDVRTQLATEVQTKAASASCKTVFVLALLSELASKGHRTLVFSQSRVMLDILQVRLVGTLLSDRV